MFYVCGGSICILLWEYKTELGLIVALNERYNHAY